MLVANGLFWSAVCLKLFTYALIR